MRGGAAVPSTTEKEEYCWGIFFGSDRRIKNPDIQIMALYALVYVYGIAAYFRRVGLDPLGQRSAENEG